MAAFSVMLLQPQQVAENLILEKEEFLCACHSDKQSLGFLSKDPQIISLISKSTALHVHLFLLLLLLLLSTFLCPITARPCDVKMPNFTFYWGRKQTKTNFFLHEFAYIWQNKRLVIIAKKNKRMRIYFLLKSNVVTAWPVVVPWTWGIDVKSCCGEENCSCFVDFSTNLSLLWVINCLSEDKN